MAFIERKIEVAVKLAADIGANQPNVFAGSRSDTLTLAGHRVSARIFTAGGYTGSRATIRVWGMAPPLMTQMSTLGKVVQMIPRNTLTVTAGDAEVGMAAVFVGTIKQAYADYNGAPDVPFVFECNAGAAEQAIPFPASSYTGATDVVTILSTIATRAHWGFENNGVTGQLSNPYLSGSAVEQVRRVAQAMQINAVLLPGAQQTNVLAIWPKYGSRQGVGRPLIAPPPAGSMIRYPVYTQQGIMVENVFNPSIVMGGDIEVRSSLPNACGLWNVLKLDHELDALLPRGEWKSTIYAFNPRYPAPLLPKTG